MMIVNDRVVNDSVGSKLEEQVSILKSLRKKKGELVNECKEDDKEEIEGNQ